MLSTCRSACAQWGKQRFEVMATGEEGTDRLSQAVDVIPGGLRVWRVFSGQLEATPRRRPSSWTTFSWH